MLQVVDEKGIKFTHGNILTIGSDGIIDLHVGVNRLLGFQLDEDGKVIVEKE